LYCGTIATIEGQLINRFTKVFKLKLRNEELHNLYASPSIIRTIKSKRIRRAGIVASMGEERKAYRKDITTNT
jgi:hypothetical protein